MKRSISHSSGSVFLLLFGFLILMLSFAEGSSQTQARWQEAVDAFQQQDYQQARKVFSELVDADIDQSEVFYNLGNCYYQLDQQGLAAWYYERVLKISPRFSDASHNLRLLREQAGIIRRETFILARPVVALYRFLSASEWVMLFLVLYALSAICATVTILLRRNRRLILLSRITTAFGVLCTLFVLCFAAPRYMQAESQQYAVVVGSGQIVVRNAPRSDAQQYFETPAGQRMQILNQAGSDWLRIKNPLDGRVGFLPSENLKTF